MIRAAFRLPVPHAVPGGPGNREALETALRVSRCNVTRHGVKTAAQRPLR